MAGHGGARLGKARQGEDKEEGNFLFVV